MALKTKRDFKILDFDIENRPLSYWVPDRPTAEITAIAWCWVGKPSSMQVRLLGKDEPETMLKDFLAAYEEADMVTGHYIRKHDLRHVNGELMDFRIGSLSPKLTCDTKLDFLTKGDIPATQEYLAQQFGVKSPKVHMTQHDWREANRLTELGLVKTQKRVVGDVRQHMALRKAMLAAGVLGPPQIWRP